VKPETSGGCSCGAVRYSLSASPVNSMICHCQSCRRAAGSPVVAWVTFARAAFKFTRGTPVEYASSPKVCRRLCGACGTPLTFAHEDIPDFVDITTCSLDDPSAFPPTHHSWLNHDVSWLKFGDGLPTFEQSRFGDPI
jgi:hypothetical protein